jgi:hypothetical protein
MKFVAIPRVRGGVMRVTRGDAHFSLDDVLCHSWYKVILRDKDSAGKVLLVPVVRLAPKKGREIHLKPGDIFQIEPAAEARTTIDEKWPPSK